MMISDEIWNRMVFGASRAPSAHNTQPALWKRDKEGHIYLLEDTRRWLSVADPQRKDHELSLGAAFEAMKIAAAEERMALGDPAPCSLAPVSSTTKYFREANVSLGADPSPLFGPLMARRTFRRPFVSVNDVIRASLQHYLTNHREVIVVESQKEIRDLAALHDRCTLDFMKDPAYYAELYSWLRFNRLNRMYDQDGLNGEAMELGWLEKIFGAIAMHPNVLRLWLKLGVAGMLTCEKKQTESASFVVFFFTKRNTSHFDSGREFMRLWLEITKLGLSMCPVSTLTDHPKVSRDLAAKYQPDDDHRLVIALRCGVTPEKPGLMTLTPRLPVHSLQLQES